MGCNRWHRQAKTFSCFPVLRFSVSWREWIPFLFYGTTRPHQTTRSGTLNHQCQYECCLHQFVDSFHSLAHYFSMFLQYLRVYLLTVTVNMVSRCMNVWIVAPCGSWFLKFHARVGLSGAILVGHPYLQYGFDGSTGEATDAYYSILFHTLVILCIPLPEMQQSCARMCKVMWRDLGPSKSPKASASSSDKPSRWPKKWA